MACFFTPQSSFTISKEFRLTIKTVYAGILLNHRFSAVDFIGMSGNTLQLCHRRHGCKDVDKNVIKF
jgi:hypothetical protein